MKQLTSTRHPLIKHLVDLREKRTYRYECQSVVVEGLTIISELAKTNRFKCMIISDERFLKFAESAEEVVIVSCDIMKKISGLIAPEGILVEMQMPLPSQLKGAKRVIALDGICDPGNMGTLFRSALALGWDAVFLIDGCDPFNEKVIRAAMGATFRLSIGWGNWETLKKIAINENLTVFGADIKGQDIASVNPCKKILLILGNEAHGLSEQAKAMCELITIPMSKEMESLNVSAAGSIIMYVLKGNLWK